MHYHQQKSREDVKLLARQVLIALLVLGVLWYVLSGLHLFVTVR